MSMTQPTELGREHQSLEHQNQQSEPEQPKPEQSKAEELMTDFRSLGNILDDIIQKLNHQVIGNCEVLESMESKESAKLLTEEAAINLKAFRTGKIDALVRQPLKLSLARLNGLRRVLDRIKDKCISLQQSSQTDNH